MNLIDILMYSIGSIGFIFALMFTYYSLQAAKLMKGSRGHQLTTVSAMLFIVVSVMGILDALFIPARGLYLSVFFVWIVALFTLIYGGFLGGKAIQKVYPGSLLKITWEYPGSIYYLIGISVLVFCGIPVYLLDILRPISGEFSWYSVFSIAIWAFSFANLTVAARRHCLFDVQRREEQAKVILFRDDILAARAYGDLINEFLTAVKPFADFIMQPLLEYFEHNPILFESCKFKQDGTIDFEPFVRNIERIHIENRVQEICIALSAICSKLLDLYGAVTSPKHAKEVLAKSYRSMRKAYRDSPVFFNILRSLPEGILEEERIALLPKEELEMRVQARTKQLYEAKVELEKAKDYTDNIIKSMADTLIVVDPDGTIETINQTTLDLLGYQENELIGKSINIIFGEEKTLLSEGSGLDDNSTKKAIVRNREKTYLSKDGRRIPVFFSASVMRADDGKTLGIICVARDITEQRKTQQEIESLSRFPSENPNPVLRINTKGEILYANRAGRKVFKAQVGKKISDRYLPVLKKAPSLKGEVSLEEKIGRRYFSSAVRFIPEAGYFNMYSRDITERKKVEKEIETYQKRLRALALKLTSTEERERRHLATELHDSIGQLLALCRIKLGELEKATNVADIRSLAEDVEKGLEEIIWYTRSLTLRLAPPVLYEVGLEAALEWLAEYMQEQYGVHTKLKVRVGAEPVDEELRVFLFRAVQELIMNVAKHAGADRVEASVSRQNDRMYITVEDRGAGFDTTVLDAPSGKDTGFGLFSIRERIRYFEGDLGVQSKPGEGTQVTLMVPLK